MKNQCWPRVRKVFGIVSNNFIYVLLTKTSCVGCVGNTLMLEAYSRDSVARLAPTLCCRRASCLRERPECSKTKPKALDLYGIQHFPVRLAS